MLGALFLSQNAINKTRKFANQKMDFIGVWLRSTDEFRNKKMLNRPFPSCFEPHPRFHNEVQSNSEMAYLRAILYSWPSCSKTDYR